MTKYKDMKDVAAAVKENGDLSPVSLGALREALGYNRLGVRVLAEIGSALADEGLGYFPAWVLENNEVPRYGDVVRVYSKNSPVGTLIDAVQEPTEPGDERLREVARGESAEKLERIRQILMT